MDKVFSVKRKYNTYYEGDELLSMCIPTVDIKDVKSYSFKRVRQDEKGRIDMFVKNSGIKDIDNAIDTVMYANHIFNPFSIDEGDILYIPNHDEKIYYERGEPILPDGTKYSSNTDTSTDTPKTYAEMVEYEARRGIGIK